MPKQYTIIPSFVTEIPAFDKMEAGILYIDCNHRVLSHLCPCGCGEEIILPLSKDFGWIMVFSGDSVSLTPSVGNGQLLCKSHYFIKENRIIWCKKIEATTNSSQSHKQQETISRGTETFFNRIIKKIKQKWLS